jgi:TRAP-type C4-dicarboxylate transport system permease small subunit
MKPEQTPTEHLQDKDDKPGARIPIWLVMLGGIPLLLAMLVEFITVVGRHTGVMILGSIEAVQVAILLSSSTAIVLATLARSHAKVRLLLNRSTGRTRTLLTVFNALCGTLFFLALTSGSVWLAADMWGASERSELLALPYFPLRCFICVSMLVTAVLYARRVLAGDKS